MNVAPLLDPTALAIVGGGTAAATLLRARAADCLRALGALPALFRRPFDVGPLLAQVSAQARIADRHGVAKLDRMVIADPDVAAAVHAIVDGADGETVATLLRRARELRARRHLAAAEIWAGAAELAPAMGMIGTLVGLAQAFATMTDPAAIGSAMAVALTATLYGALLANLLFAPIATRLRAAARVEFAERCELEPPLTALARREAPRVMAAA